MRSSNIITLNNRGLLAWGGPLNAGKACCEMKLANGLADWTAEFGGLLYVHFARTRSFCSLCVIFFFCKIKLEAALYFCVFALIWL